MIHAIKLSRTFIALSFVAFATGAYAVNVEDCTSEKLNQSCNYENAHAQLNCLKSRIKQFQDCQAKLEEYDGVLHSRIKQKIEEKGKKVTDPLKEEKADHLAKLKQLESILRWHDENLRGTAVTFARFTKEFTNSYKASEQSIQGKFQQFWNSVNEVKNYLDLIKIRFAVRSFLLDEQSQNTQFVSRSTRLIADLQAVESFIKEKLAQYKTYLEKNSFPEAPSYTREIGFARAVAGYAQTRVAKVEDESRKILQSIDIIILEMEKTKLREDKKRDFKEAKLIERETSFHAQVVQLVDNALIKEDVSQYHNAQFLGARFNGIQQLLALDSICNPENMRQPGNEWLGWGCKKYNDFRDTAKNRLSSEFPTVIRATLESMDTEKPQFEVSQKLAIIESLKLGNLEQAVGFYDKMLIRIAQNNGGKQ